MCAPLLLAGCAGYTLGEIKPATLKAVRTLHIPTFTNNTLEPRIESLVTDTIIRQLQQDGTYVITSADKADAILNGQILSLRRYSIRGVRGNPLASAELALNLALQYEVVDNKTGVKLEGGTVSGRSSFFIGSDIQQDERQAVPLAAEDAAQRLAVAISEGF